MVARAIDAVSDAAAAWIDLVRRRAAVVLTLVTAVTAAAAYVTATDLAIDTDTASMISPDLAFRRHAETFMTAFPQFADTIVIVTSVEVLNKVKFISSC